MSATDPLPRPACAGLLAATLLAACIGLHAVEAQGTPVVTDADIEHARRSQPVVTDQDVERAQQKHRMPTDQELSRVPLPAAPHLDALPRPGAPPAVDLEALAKGYAADAERGSALPGMPSGPGLMIFVSFSMPQPALQRLVDQAARSQALLVVRGFVNGSLRDTVTHVQGLLGNHRAAFQIDPQAFDRFSISRVPAFVLMHAGAQAQPCSAGLCLTSDAFVETAGDVSLDYALEFMERSAPRFAGEARAYLQKIRE